MKEVVIGSLLALVGAALVALMTWWLTEWSRDRAERQKDRAVQEALLAVQSDALLLAVVDLQTAATTNRILWEGPLERGQSFLLAAIAAGAECAASDHEGPEWRRMLRSLGAAGAVLGLDRIAVKTAVSGLKAELGRLAAATVPLMRHPDARICAATEQVMTAATAGDPSRAELETAMREFGQAVRAVLPAWSPPSDPPDPGQA
nr:hypothetical protein OH826_20090 [Streptomyces sp. NBC_00899]